MKTLSFSKPDLSLDEQIKQAILEMGAIRHVYITPKDYFFIFKFPGSWLEYAHDMGESHSFVSFLIQGSHFREGFRPQNFCYIFHKERLIKRDSNAGVVTKQMLSNAGFDAKKIFNLLIQGGCGNLVSSEEFHLDDNAQIIKPKLKQLFPKNAEKILDFLEQAPRGEVDDNYLGKYRKEINSAPEFQLDTMFTAKLRLGSYAELGYGFKNSNEDPRTHTFYEPDYLIPRKGIKIQSPKHWKPISDLLRRVGLLKENRGKIKSVDSTTETLRTFILKEFKAMKRKKPLPLQLLKGRLESEVDRLFPDDSEQADKYYWSEATIRRLIESSIKK